MMTETTESTELFDALDDDVELQARLVRKALKTRFQGRVSYRQGDYIEGAATAKNLGHGDIVLRLNRYLAPGDPVHLQLDCLTYRGLPISMRGEVMESMSVENGGGFSALVHVRRDSYQAVA